MKQISQEEFEQYVEAIISGEMSRTQVVRELQTEARTLNNRIHELVATNPELYQRYVEKVTYQPRERKDLNAVQLAVEILKQGKNIEQIAQEHQTGRRTIQRRINTLKDSEDGVERRLFDICKEATKLNSRGAKRSQEFEAMIEEVLNQIEMRDLGPLKDKQSNIEERREDLLRLEQRYNELCETMSKGEAAKALGYTKNRIFKLLNELYCIEIERAATKQSRDFRQGLKVEVDGIGKKDKEIVPETGETLEKEME